MILKQLWYIPKQQSTFSQHSSKGQIHSKLNHYNTFYYGNRFIFKTNISYYGFHQYNYMVSLFKKQVQKFLHGFGKYIQLIFDILSIKKGIISLLGITNVNHTHGQLLSIYMIGGMLKFRVLHHNYGIGCIL